MGAECAVLVAGEDGSPGTARAGAASAGHVSEEREMEARHPRGGRLAASAALAGAVLLSALAGAAGAAQRVALVIGNAAYEHTEALRNPGNDAAAMAAKLRSLGFYVVVGTDLDLDGFDHKLDEFEEAAREAEVTLFFYAGHGLQVDGKNWLVPVDAELEKKRDLKRRAVELDDVTGSMPGKKKLVFLDACRNNPLAGDLARSMGLSRAVAAQRGLARVESGDGMLIGYATQPGNTTADGAGDNSPYTTALLEHIATPGLSVDDMLTKVTQSVLAATARRQAPWKHSSLPEIFYFKPIEEPLAAAGGDAVEEALPPKATGAPTAGGTPPPTGDAARAYEAAERIGTVDAYRIVVEDFPDSTYAKFAQAWIAKHEQEPIVVAGGDPDDIEPVVTPPPPSPKEVEQDLKLSGEAKRLIQMGLAAAGHDPGPADGVFGGRTRKALRAWQGSKELEGTGYLTREQSEGLVASGKREEERPRMAAAREREAREAEERRRAAAERERKVREAEEAARRAEAERKAREAEERRKRAQEPGYKFRDCPGCPEMVVVPAGSFMMGSPEAGRYDDEGPVHRVTIARPFAVGVYEVTFGEWDACVAGGGCGGHRLDDWGWGRGRRPVIYVSWEDAQAYVRWLSGKTGKAYRLLSESEWEYVARAGTTTRYWWGDGIGRNRANCDGCGSRWDGKKTAPVGSFSANGFGLHDVHGNVWEWVEDCWNDSYHGAPTDGSAWTSRIFCIGRVLRGGSWGVSPRYLRSANRYWDPSGLRSYNAGFRVARTLTP